MNKAYKDVVEGMTRMVALGVAGWLVYGWRGALASLLIGWYLKSLAQDLLEGIATISRLHRGGKNG